MGAFEPVALEKAPFVRGRAGRAAAPLGKRAPLHGRRVVPLGQVALG